MDQHTQNLSATEHRIDAPHQASATDESVESDVVRPARETVGAAAGQSAETAEERLLFHAHQLSMDLAQRQRDIDRRESQFNAYLATLENDSRAARLKLSERQSQIAALEDDYRARFAELALREAQLDGREHFAEVDDRNATRLEEQRRVLAEREIHIEAEENRLRFAWQQIQTKREAALQMVRLLTRSLERRRAAWEEQYAAARVGEQTKRDTGELKRLADELDQREREMHEAENELSKNEAQLNARQSAWQAERAQWEQTRKRDLQRIEKQREIDAQQHKRRQETLSKQSDELSQRRAAVEQLQERATLTHREALELRFATEQLWSQLADNISPREMAQSLGELRARIAEHYRLAEESLAAQRGELQEMAKRLDQQQRQLGEQRDQGRGWFDRRREEIEIQAARLIAREQQLDAQQSQHESLIAAWDQQRHEYEDEIRRLQAQLRQRRLRAA